MNGELDVRLQSAVALHGRGLPEQAAVLYAEILRTHPDHADALHLLGVTETQLGRPRSGLDWIARSLAVNPDQPAAIANRGNAFLALGEPGQALACYDEALRSWPDYGAAVYGRGNALSALGDLAAALCCFERALELAPNFLQALMARGGVLRKLRRHAEAVEAYERAIAAAPTASQAYLGRAMAERALKKYDQAIASCDRALQLAPDCAEAFAERGHVLSERGRIEEAIDAYDRALRLDPMSAVVWFSRGIALSVQGRFVEAAAALRRALQADPQLPYARGTLLHAQLRVCDWSDHMAAAAAISTALQRDDPADFPFALLAVCDSPSLQLRCAQRYARSQRAGRDALPPSGRRDRGRIRIAYLSEDFLEHPTSYLMAGVLERHDRQRFEIVGVSWRDQDSPTARRVRAAFDRLVPAESVPDEALARLLRGLEVDIAVDLMGYTGSHRSGLFAHRPAAIQVSYLGFPSTMGSPDIDYLVADEYVVPEAERGNYSESIAYLPECFQANDDRRPSVARAPTRAQMGLPATGLVMCSFHNSYKLNPPLFDVWCRLLSATPDAVLWLVAATEIVQHNLRREALTRGISPERLVFAEPLPYPEHLARLGLADLCLDTIPFNGGTTTSDALWAGVPVLTCAGRGFAARMSGSLLRTIGMPELVTESLDEYERLALQLAASPARLAGVRAALALRRRSSPLFDTDRFRRHLEAVYAVMIERHRDGLPPATFRVDALAP
jgi:protein O-GlcNAc transferase